MNDLALLEQHGPAAVPLSDDALAAARARLATAMTTPRRRPRRRVLLAAAAAAAIAVGLAAAPAVLKSDRSLALASVDPLTFPVTATWLPPGLPLQRFAYNPQQVMYGPDPSCDAGQPCVGERVTIAVRDSWKYWDIPKDARAVDVNGRPGKLMGAPWADHQAETWLVWEEADGDVIGVTGEGRYSDPAVVERIADSVVDRSQRVDLFLTIAPAGWQVHGYQSDSYVSYGPSGELAISLLQGTDVSLDDYRSHDSREVTVDGRRGMFGRQADGDGKTTAWVLVTTAPDGQPFSLQAPATLTERQVIEIAAGVRHR